MRILSKFQDYYDHIGPMWQGGVVDPRDKVWERKQTVSERVLEWAEVKGQPRVLQMPRLYPWSSSKPYTHELRLLVVAGKSYPVVETLRSENLQLFHDGLIPHLVGMAFYTRLKKARRFSWDKSHLQETLDSPIMQMGFSSPFWLALSKKLETAVFLIEDMAPSNSLKKLSHLTLREEAPKLKDVTGFPVLKPAELLYQELDYFFNNLLNPSADIAPPKQVSNEEKIIAHGFDLKTSFRKASQG